jgi:hypothetical protein
MNTHQKCCETCKKLQRSPTDPETAVHYDLLVKHLLCLKNETDRNRCQRKAELRAAAKWILEILPEES